MRKTIPSGIAALGFLAIAVTAFGSHTFVRQADAEGSGADVRMNGHNLVAVVDTNRSSRPLLVAILLHQPTDADTG